MTSNTQTNEIKIKRVDWVLLFVVMVMVPLMLVRVILHSYFAVNGYENSLPVGAFWLGISALLLNKELKKVKSVVGFKSRIKLMWIVATVIVLLVLLSAAYQFLF